MAPIWENLDLPFDVAAERFVARHKADGDARDLPIMDLRTWGLAPDGQWFSLRPLAGHEGLLRLRANAFSALCTRLGAPADFVRGLPEALQLATMNWLLSRGEQPGSATLRLRSNEVTAIVSSRYAPLDAAALVDTCDQLPEHSLQMLPRLWEHLAASVDEFRRVLRRAECLFALIAIRHARVVGDEDDGRHGRAMVGRDKLLRIEEDADGIVLEDYAALEGPNRYFKNKLGGLGQYYFGPLRDLRVLDHHEGAGYPGYDDQRGRKLAEALASAVPENDFFRVLEQQTTTWEELDELVAFCPCKMRDNAAEHALLLDLFLARTEPFQGDGGKTRRASLGLMLDLAGQAARDSEYVFEGLLRGGAYTGALVDGSAWQVAEPLQRVLRGWGTYQRNELLSIGVQGLFAAILRAIERDEGRKIRQAGDAADVAVRLLSSFGADLGLPLDALVARVRGALPDLADWQHEDHELQRGWRLQNLRLKDDTNLEEIARESVEILLALLARGVDEYPYGDFELDPEYFDPREVHLLSLRHAVKNEWTGLTVGDWIRWVAVQWGVARHLRVALRKLRGERRDTFRIRPLDGELRVVEAPEPVFTQPRVGRAQQILRDLCLVEYDDEGVMILTNSGRAELEACRGG